MRNWAIGGLALGAGALGAGLYTSRKAREAEAAVPMDGRMVEAGGHRFHVAEQGQGRPLLLIHGLAGQMRNFSYALLDRLATDYRVILIDRPGSGYSAPGETANIRAQAAQIARFIAALELEKPLVVGHSLGGAVALALACPSVPGTARMPSSRSRAPSVCVGLAA